MDDAGDGGHEVRLGAKNRRRIVAQYGGQRLLRCVPRERVNARQHLVQNDPEREQNLQDVPIVVTAVSEQLLKDTGVKDIKDLTILTPGLIVTSTSNETVYCSASRRRR